MMRIIVYGVGAIGGTVAAALTRSGVDVAGIARGAHLAAIRDKGLTLNTPDGAFDVRFPCFADPAEIDLRADDAILVTVKGQDTADVIARLRAAGVTGQPVFCVQNDVDNERAALRHFPNVYAVTVMMPATYSEAGTVSAFGAPKYGIFDIGRYPSGTDAVSRAVAAMLSEAGIASFEQDEVMRSKYGKLLLNTANILDAAFADRAQRDAWAERFYEEARSVYRAAGITWTEVGLDDPRRTSLMQVQGIAGVERIGSSSLQSLVRHAGSIETDYLNGEIALLGRLNGVPTPLNAWACGLGQALVTGTRTPGSVSDAEIAAIA